MKNKRGFINIGFLITILIGLAIFGGGTYYVSQQQSSMQTASDDFDNLQQLPTTNNQVQTTTDSHTPLPATQPAPVTFTSANLTASPMSEVSPLSVNFSGRIEVPNNQRGAAVVFFGDGVSAVMSRKGPTLFSEEWSHTYTKAGEYDVILAITTESNVDADFEVMKNSNYYKNVIVKKIRVSVQASSASSKSDIEVLSLSYPVLTYRINRVADSNLWLRIIDVTSGLSMWQKSGIEIGTHELNLAGLVPYEGLKISLQAGTYRLRLEAFTNSVGKTLAESDTFDVKGTVVAVPTCTIRLDASTLTWTSQNTDESYIAHSLPKDGNAAIYGLNNGKNVLLNGSETVNIVSGDNYWLVAKNAQGATVCRLDGSSNFSSQKEIENPQKMG